MPVINSVSFMSSKNSTNTFSMPFAACVGACPGGASEAASGSQDDLPRPGPGGVA